ncbi:signal peptidase I [Evansella halocellulosilytica]|uniref:signal peptidase I n=1 Tax=Evansella halocellulosilytica TaxID=2011013 RepID=UPI000BB96837|nr:signal peptidase I [Evansella halocellulosilytica]
MSFLNKIVVELYSWVKAIFIALLLAVLISVFIIQPYSVDGGSMEPSFQGLTSDKSSSGDRVIAFKTPYLLGSSPDFGEIVIIDSRVENERTLKDEFLESNLLSFISNTNDQHQWIKRVIGVPGDKIEIKNGSVYRNGEILEEGYIKESLDNDLQEITVPEDSVFVMGDNRNNSIDSRNIGPIPVENVIGKVVLRYYPFDKIDLF